MTSGLFHMHGVWEGRCRGADKLNERGFHENLDFKLHAKKLCGALVGKCQEAEPNREFLDRFSATNPTSPWMVKHSAMYWKLWLELDPVYLCVRRNIEACIKSNKRAKTLTGSEDDLRRIIKGHHKVMDKVKDTYGAVDIFTDEIISGNYASLDRAFSYCGMKMNKRVVEDFVSPRLWHFSS